MTTHYVQRLNSIQFFTYFDVKEFCPLSSDIHCSIEFAMESYSESIEPQIPVSDKVKHWKNDKKLDFLSNIDIKTVGVVMSALLDITDPAPDKNVINNTVDILSKCLLDGAKKTFGEYPQAPLNNVKNVLNDHGLITIVILLEKHFTKVNAIFYQTKEMKQK